MSEECHQVVSRIANSENQLFLEQMFFVHPIFCFLFLVTFGNEVTKIRKYYVIFVNLLQGKRFLRSLEFIIKKINWDLETPKSSKMIICFIGNVHL